MFQTCWIYRGHSSPAASSRNTSWVLCRKKLKSELHVWIMKWMSGEAVSHRDQRGRHWEFVYLFPNSVFISIVFCCKMLVSLHLKAKKSSSSIPIKFSVQTLLLLFFQHPCLQVPGQYNGNIQRPRSSGCPSEVLLPVPTGDKQINHPSDQPARCVTILWGRWGREKTELSPNSVQWKGARDELQWSSCMWDLHRGNITGMAGAIPAALGMEPWYQQALAGRQGKRWGRHSKRRLWAHLSQKPGKIDLKSGKTPLGLLANKAVSPSRIFLGEN